MSVDSLWAGAVKTITVFERPINFTEGDVLRLDIENAHWDKISPNGDILESGRLKVYESPPTADKSPTTL